MKTLSDLSALSLAGKIISAHLVSGEMKTGSEIGIRIDQTLTQDATGTMAYLQFMSIGIPKVKTELSASYVDHNTLQTSFENPDDHEFLRTVAGKYGIFFSRPGNGICHQVHLERFGIPGKTLLGSDSHTPTAGGLGMLAIGAGGLDVAVAMGGGPFYLTMPKIVLVKLSGKLKPWVSAKDVILELLRKISVKGGVGKILEYGGDGVKTLSVPERATITNMGAETGATTSIFPSDEITKAFLKAQGRLKGWKSLIADRDAQYDEVIEIDLSKLVPLVACPHSPDNVKPAKELSKIKVNQVCIGSCTNSSLRDMKAVAGILKGKKVHPEVSLTISPGSRQVLEMISRDGTLAEIISAGARILETTCGPCIGMGQAPPSGGVSVRTFNRNFEGRSGTQDAQVYLTSPETAAATAIKGYITDPRTLRQKLTMRLPKKYLIDDRMVIHPAKDPEKIEIKQGPNIKPLPIKQPIEESLSGVVLLKVGDNITTDHIMPAGAKVLPYRSNIPKMAEFVFEGVDATFSKRAKEKGGGFIIGGANYGQGSSREHAALAPMYLGIKAVIAKSFARIHKANLINFGILPLTLANESDYEKVSQNDELEISSIREIQPKTQNLTMKNKTSGADIPVKHDLTTRQVEIILAGGLLNWTKKGTE
ncbi:MAG: aconitate hydratase [Candidatus Edwardsbacteria bacterium]